MKLVCAPDLWAITEPYSDGHLLLHFTISGTRRDAIHEFRKLASKAPQPWRQWYRKGFRAIRVKVVTA